MKNYARLLVTSTITATALSSLLFAGTGANAATAVDDTPPPIVETYDYPGAEQIFAERGIRLLKGDGHILFADCGSGGNLVEVWSRTAQTPFCFRITGAQGFLSLSLARVYLIKGDDHVLRATMLIKDAPAIIDVAKNQWTSVGEGADPQNGPSALVELNSGNS